MTQHSFPRQTTTNSGQELTSSDSSMDEDQSTETAPSAQEASKKNIPDIPVSQVQHVKTQEELDMVLKAHGQWIEQVLDPNVEVASGRANLCGVDLRGFSLKEANLSGANLSQANLTEVDLTGANLSATNLQRANLACANLSGAKLRGAKLEGADLRGADLTGAFLTGVDLSKTILKSPEQPPSKPDPEEPLTHELHQEEAPEVASVAVLPPLSLNL